MAGLIARFSLIDEMSSRLADIAERGQDMISKWEKAGATIQTAFDDISGSSAQAVSAVDGVAYSIEDIRKELDAMGNGASKETMLEVLTNYLKPVLMNIIQSEIYEEGDLSYDY